MTVEEIARLLTMIADYDHREVAQSDVHAWNYVLSDLRFSDAVQAVRSWYATEVRRIAPADVRKGVKAVRGRRVSAAELQPPPDIDPDDVAAYNAWMRRALAEAADGVSRALMLPSVPPPPDFTRRRGRDPQAISALSVACPWCHARPGERCIGPRTKRPLTHTPAHPSRLDAARTQEVSP